MDSNGLAYRYLASKGWEYRLNGTEDEAIIETCPICHKSNWKSYLHISGGEKDGLFVCHHGSCNAKYTLYQLAAKLGDRINSANRDNNNLLSMQDVARKAAKAEALPDVEACHKALMKEAEDPNAVDTALDYLLDRGFTMAVIQEMKLGLTERAGRRCIVYPYLNPDGYEFAKFRFLPPATKDERFGAPSGRKVGLYNAKAITKKMPKLVVSEGESDSLALKSNGIDYVIGVPGAGISKATWVDQIDEAAPEQIYICFDNDSVGRKRAKELAARIGIDKCRNIVIPAVEYTTDDGEVKQTKDVGEWFKYGGGTAAQFAVLEEEAQLFPVEGIVSAEDALSELREELVSRGSLKPKYDFAWPSVNKIAGGMEEGDLVGWLAPQKSGKSTALLTELEHFVRKYEEPVLFICDEMPAKRLVRKLIANITDTNDEDINLETFDTALGLFSSYKADILFGASKNRKYDSVQEMIYQARRRYGVRAVGYDHLQQLVNSVTNAAQEISNIMGSFKALAMELRIIQHIIIQPHRVREDQIAGASNASGSNRIGDMVDTMLCFHRNREGKISAKDFDAMGQNIEVAENFMPAMLCRADLTRYASGGATTLWFDGAKSKVTEYPGNSAQATAQMNATYEDLGIAA